MKEYWLGLGKITFFRKLLDVKRGANSLCVQENRVYWTTLFFTRFFVHFFVPFFSSGSSLAVFLSAFLSDFLSEFFPDFLSDYLPNSLFDFLSNFLSNLSGSPLLCLILCVVLRLEIFPVEIRVPLSSFQKDSRDPGNSGQYLSFHLEFWKEREKRM